MLLGVNGILYLCTYIINRISAFSYKRVTHDRCDTCFYKIPMCAGRKALCLFIYIIITIYYIKKLCHKCHLSHSQL